MTQLQREVGRLRALIHVGRAVSGSLGLSEVVKLAMDVTAEVLQVEAASLLLVDPERGDLYFDVAEGEKAAQVRTIRLKMGQGIAGVVAEKQESLIVNDCAHHPLFDQNVDRQTGFQTRSLLAVPLAHEARLIGVLEVMNKRDGSDFTKDDQSLSEAVAGQLAIAIENAQLLEEKVQSERLVAVGQAVAGSAHCIRNILNCIQGGGFIVDTGAQEKNLEGILEGWDIVKRSNAFLGELVMDMLAYAKERKPYYEETDISEFCRTMQETIASSAEKRGVTVTTDLGPVGAAELDVLQMKRCLLNLLGNAVDACEDSRGTVTIATREGDPPGWLEIRISDTGCGIAPDDLAKLFRAFFSTKGAKGTGLGLPVSEKIVREHGGRVEVQSTLGQGTTFILHLPKRHEGKEA